MAEGQGGEHRLRHLQRLQQDQHPLLKSKEVEMLRTAKRGRDRPSLFEVALLCKLF